MAIWELKAVDLVFDIFNLHSWVLLKASQINLVIEMADVTNDGVVLHLSHVFDHDNLIASSCCDEDVSGLENTLESLHFEAFHASLQGANWVAFSDNDASSACLHCSCTSLTDITVSADDNLLSSDHNISSSHKTIWK